ncbi:MAG: hypothetical protein P8Y38_04900 [Deltaproteobacteria bacterium]|jgi:hypothetical protein
MEKSIPINKQNANAEIVARIIKVASKKYDCNMHIDFQHGHRTMKFVGEETLKPFIALDVNRIFHGE